MNGSGTGSGGYHSDEEFEEFGGVSNNRPGQQYRATSSVTGSIPIPMMSSSGQITNSCTATAGGSGTTVIQPKVEMSATTCYDPPLGATQALPSTSGQRAAPGGGGGNICSLLDDGRRCQRPAGNASYSKRVQKTVFYKRLRLDVDNTAHHTYICDHHKTVIQTARVQVKKESDEEGVDNATGEDGPEVDLYQLQVNTLRRYKKHFKIPTRPGLNKAQLADTLTKHFKTIPVNEKEIITYFIYSIKSGKNKLDNPQPTGTVPKEEYMDPY